MEQMYNCLLFVTTFTKAVEANVYGPSHFLNVYKENKNTTVYVPSSFYQGTQ